MLNGLIPYFDKYVQNKMAKDNIVFYVVLEQEDEKKTLYMTEILKSEVLSLQDFLYPLFALLALDKRNKLLISKDLIKVTDLAQKKEILDAKYLPACLYYNEQARMKVNINFPKEVLDRIKPTEMLLYLIRVFNELVDKPPVHTFPNKEACSLPFFKKYDSIQIGNKKYINLNSPAISHYMTNDIQNGKRHFIIQNGAVVSRVNTEVIIQWLEEEITGVFEEVKNLMRDNDWFKVELEKQKDVFSKHKNYIPAPPKKPTNNANKKGRGKGKGRR